MAVRVTMMSALVLLLLSGLSGCAGRPVAAAPSAPGVQFQSKALPIPDELALIASRDPEHLTLATKFVEFETKDGKPILSLSEVKKLMEGINRYYAACHIHFRVEEYDVVDPSTRGLPYGTKHLSEMAVIRKPFDDPKDLVVVNTGAWDHSSVGAPNAWTAMPGERPSGAVIEGPVATFAGIVAHELGHYLGLDHVKDPANVMNPIIYQNSRKIERWQCKEMRHTAISAWPQALRGGLRPEA